MVKNNSAAASAAVCNYTKETCEVKFGAFKKVFKKVNWKSKEAALSSVNSDNKIERFLNEVKVENFFDHLKNSYKPKNNLYSRLMGLYTGDVLFDDPRQSALKMEFEVKNDLTFKKGDYLSLIHI